MAGENRAGQGRRERPYRRDTGATEDAGMRRFAGGQRVPVVIGATTYPRSALAWSTSRTRRRRAIATISPRPIATSAAATAITESAKIWPARSPCWRANAISVRFAALSMISSESRTINGLRRIITPSAPIPNRSAATIRYQPTSGPLIRARPAVEAAATSNRRPCGSEPQSFVCPVGERRGSSVSLLLGRRSEDDTADRCNEQHDRGDLEGEEGIGEE